MRNIKTFALTSAVWKGVDALVGNGRGILVASALLHLRRPDVVPAFVSPLSWALGGPRDTKHATDPRSDSFALRFLLQTFHRIAADNADALAKLSAGSPIGMSPIDILAFLLTEVGSQRYPMPIDQALADALARWQQMEG